MAEFWKRKYRLYADKDGKCPWRMRTGVGHLRCVINECKKDG